MRTFILAVAGLAAGVVGGCQKGIRVNRVPEFYDPDIQTVAVPPFENRSGFEGAGEMVAGRLAMALRETGTYKIIDPYQVRARLALPPVSTDAPDEAALERQIEVR